MKDYVALLGQQFDRSYRVRKLKSAVMKVALITALVIALIPLYSLLSYVTIQGASSLNLDFFGQLPKPVGEPGGGMANAIAGSFVIVGIASILGVLWGISIGLYLSEFGRGRMATMIRFCTEMLASIPSIIIGLFVYAIIVMPMHRFSAFAGGIALGLIAIPIIAKTSEELLRLMPVHIREAGLALGLPRWKVTLHIVLKGSLRGISTGVVLAIARIAGETAPLLFTSFNNQYWSRRLDQPTASLPVQIFTYSISPFEEWHRLAWAGSFLLIVVVFVASVMTRLFLRRPSESR